MALEQALTCVLAVAVPVWLVGEQLIVRRRSAEESRVQTASATREKSALRRAALLS